MSEWQIIALDKPEQNINIKPLKAVEYILAVCGGKMEQPCENYMNGFYGGRLCKIRISF